MKEKKEILEKAAKEKWILVFEHCPHLAASYVAQTDKGYQPTESVNL